MVLNLNSGSENFQERKFFFASFCVFRIVVQWPSFVKNDFTFGFIVSTLCICHQYGILVANDYFVAVCVNKILA